MIRIVSASHYFRRYDDHERLDALDARVNAVSRERYRRIDRFVQLALLGACECAQGQRLAPDCGLYLASGVGPIGSNIAVQDAIHRDRKVPMPFSFVNTLGSSACFHVAKDLGLNSDAILVARDGGSFTAALRCALADLSAGVVSQVLVGAVEECTLPGATQRALLRKPSTVATAEGSHWVLVERADVHGDVVGDAQMSDATFDGYESADVARITSYVARHRAQAFGLTWPEGAPGLGAGTLVAMR